MSQPGLKRWAATVTLFLVLLVSGAFGQQTVAARKGKVRVIPAYPELAREMNLAGTVRLQVQVEADGKVKNMKVLGGSPLLAQAAMDSVRKWRFEPAPATTSEVVEIRFQPERAGGGGK